MAELNTHARWLTDCADRCVAELRSSGAAADWRYYSNVAHQIAQARPEELREFVKSYPRERALAIAPLMVLAWRHRRRIVRPILFAGWNWRGLIHCAGAFLCRAARVRWRAT